MSILKWSALQAGAFFLFFTILSANTLYSMSLEDILYSFYKGTYLGLNIAYIIASALVFFTIYEALGYLNELRAFLNSRKQRSYELAFLLSVFMGGFLESIAGFGIPVAVISPILVSLGFKWTEAIKLSLVGHSWAVSYAAFGIPTNALSSVTYTDFHKLCAYTAIFLALGLTLIIIYEIRALGTEKISTSLCFYALLSPALLLVLTSITGAYGSLLVSLIMLSSSLPLILGMGATKFMLKLLSPYYVLSFILLLAMLFRKAFHDSMFLDIVFNTGTITLFFTLIIVMKRRKELYISNDKLKTLIRNIAELAIAFVTLMNASTLATHSGMMQDIANSLLSLLGKEYTLMVPFIGLLGTYMTGSNTASNVLFGPLQMEYSQVANLSAYLLLANHNAGGALGSIISPAKILAGTYSIDKKGKEGEVLRMCLKVALLLALAIDMEFSILLSTARFPLERFKI